MYQYHKWLRAFHAVAKKGSFTKAAEYLSVGQPTLSEQVKSLEKVFSVELFYRRGRYVEITPAGISLYGITQGIFAQEDEAIQLLQSFKQKKKGMLRIGAVSPPIAMSLTYKLVKKYPEIDIETSFSTESETLKRLHKFDIDIAILALKNFSDTVYTVPYITCPVLGIVPDDHPWGKREKVSIKEITGEPLVLREEESRTRQIVEEKCIENGIELDCVMQLNSREAIVHAVMQGVGIGFVSSVEYAAHPGIKAVSFDDNILQIKYVLCCLERRKNRPLINDVMHSKP